MKKFITFFLVLLFGLFIVSCKSTGDVGSDAYVITYNGGGLIYEFNIFANQLAQSQQLVVLDGRCYSACTLIVTNPNVNVCATDTADLYFHQGKMQDGTRFEMTYTRPWSDWIALHGGTPTNGWLRMKQPEISSYIRTCTKADWWGA